MHKPSAMHEPTARQQPPQPPCDITVDDWSHVRETINMLLLAVCQIETTMADSNTSVDTLTQSFTSLAEHNSDVNLKIQAVKAPEDLAQFKSELQSTTAQMHSHISTSVQAFQFYDRVCQRLDHVARSLEKVSEVMNDNHTLHEPKAWRDIQVAIRDSYTMEAERVMFEHIMQGGSINEALNVYQQHFDHQTSHPKDDPDDVELF